MNWMRLNQRWLFYHHCSLLKQTYNLTTKRFRYKPKWATHEKRLTNCHQALGHFDAFYKPVYKYDWPSIRVSLLSLPKHCAAVNYYGNCRKTEEKLLDLGTSDFLLNADLSVEDQLKSEALQENTEIDGQEKDSLPSNPSNDYHDDSLNNHTNLSGEILQESQYADDDLNVFVPTEKVYSEKDQLLREEMSLNSFESRDISFEMLPAETLNYQQDLKTFVFPSGVVSKFPSPKSYNGVLGYYLMDAASILPVLALDVQPTDKVLDLCAAPGGKSYLILQSLRFYEGGKLHCNDSAQARLSRLRSVLKLYFPQDVVQQITVTKMDGTSVFPTAYNKVLVDVPCNSDRHVVTEDENNLFKISRTRERLDLVHLQKNLLISAIKSCLPGGTIVYSTCTLSPAQNDGVIQAVAEELWETSEMEVAVQDLSNIRHALSHTFKFYDKSRYGLTVLPTLLNNFGPSYVAKLRRMK
ncbi:5-methylcytosine rRNA methyltransferase NSUN4 [Elysia marginata]|uniref:NOL1/NOP2/Sun domain family member 4 n=1 Tax=Elysia marginata TaxID=1093978 RepID=A0AAV4IKG7_9GAST|nr:5-methylcytosine rRNA methyltransferase NSUN4 [Elysia marginata]